MRTAAIAGALALLAACTSAPLHLGSDIPAAAQLTPGRVIEGAGCDFLWGNDRYLQAYRQLQLAAGKDLITDVEIREGSNCTSFRAKAVRIAKAEPVAPVAVPAAAPPAIAPEPAPPTFAKGAMAQLKPGGTVRTRPRASGDPLGGDAGPLQLGADTRNEEGHWWYVSAGGKSGWALEGDLAPALP